jgi:hypothetical protein
MTAMKLLWVTLVLLGEGKWGRFVGGHGEHAALKRQRIKSRLKNRSCVAQNSGRVDERAPTVPCANTACDSFLQAGCHAYEASGRQRRAMRSASVEQHSCRMEWHARRFLSYELVVLRLHDC